MIRVYGRRITIKEASVYFDIPASTICCRYAHGLRGDILVSKLAPKKESHRKVEPEVRVKIFKALIAGKLSHKAIAKKFNVGTGYVQDFLWRLEGGS